MEKPSVIILCGVLIAAIFGSCDSEKINQGKVWLQNKTNYKIKWQQLRYHVRKQKEYKDAAIALAQRNRELRIKNNKMMFEIQELQAKLAFAQKQTMSNKKWREQSNIQARRPAGLFSKPASAQQNWRENQDFLLAENEFKRKNYSKAFEYFQSYAKKYPKNNRIDDWFLFRTGLAGFESRQYNQAAWYFQQLVDIHPKSKLYRSSKLWVGLSHLKMGNKEKFVQTVKEFKNKYQNTPEWKVLKEHYENIILQKS